MSFICGMCGHKSETRCGHHELQAQIGDLVEERSKLNLQKDADAKVIEHLRSGIEGLEKEVEMQRRYADDRTVANEDLNKQLNEKDRLVDGLKNFIARYSQHDRTRCATWTKGPCTCGHDAEFEKVMGTSERPKDETPKRQRHESPCVLPLSSDTCVYLADGNKVVVCRDKGVKGAVWLEVKPQAIFTLQGGDTGKRDVSSPKEWAICGWCAGGQDDPEGKCPKCGGSKGKWIEASK